MPQRSLTPEGLASAAQALAERDDDLARILVRFGAPPLWSRRPGFPTLVRIILEQQVSLASARALFRRLAAGVRPFAARRFVELGAPHFQSLGVTRQKAACCLALARTLAGKQLDLAAVARMDDSAARDALMQVRGIGPWTAEIYLLMALRRVDVWPSGDLALVAAMGRLKGIAGRPTPGVAAAIAEGWRPFRSVAARMLWQYYLAERREGKRDAGGGFRGGRRASPGRDRAAGCPVALLSVRSAAAVVVCSSTEVGGKDGQRWAQVPRHQGGDSGQTDAER